MRSVRFFPLAFIAGVDGFIVFAPYVLLVMVADHFLRRRRKSISR